MGVIGYKPPVDATYKKKRAELYESARVLHVFEAFGVCLRYTELVRCDGVAEVFYSGCKPVASIQAQQYDGCIECGQYILSIPKVLVIVFKEKYKHFQ